MGLFSSHDSRKFWSAGLAALLLAASWGAGAQENKPAPAAAPADGKDAAASKEPPALPAEAHVAQTIQLEGKALRYTVTIGALPVTDNGKKIGEVVCTA